MDQHIINEEENCWNIKKILIWEKEKKIIDLVAL